MNDFEKQEYLNDPTISAAQQADDIPIYTTEDLDEKYSVGTPGEENKSSKAKKFNLSSSQERTIKELAQIGDSVELFAYLESLDLSPSAQTEIATHYMKDLEESILRIAWTKERLYYLCGILFGTLMKSDKNNLTSTDNMILNYLVFCEKFKGKYWSKSAMAIPKF
mgnify:FL=1